MRDTSYPNRVFRINLQLILGLIKYMVGMVSHNKDIKTVLDIPGFQIRITDETDSMVRACSQQEQATLKIDRSDRIGWIEEYGGNQK